MNGLASISKEFEKIGYDNLFFPFEDCLRNDRIVAFSHKTNDRIEIFNNPYVFKYNEKTKIVKELYIEEAKLIKKLKEELKWESKININYINYMIKNRKDETK